MIYICLFLSELLHSVWQSLGLSMLLQMNYFVLFDYWVISPRIYIPNLLYPFLCWWAFKLLPHVLTIGNSAVMNMGVYVSVQIILFSRYIPRSGIAVSYGSFICSFFFSFILISWRLITLHYCSGFCHTLTWISHGFTCIFAAF